MTLRPKHEVALDELRAALIRKIAYAYKVRWSPLWMSHSDRRIEIRGLIARVRALDALREKASERAFMADLWMYVAAGFSREEAMRKARADRAAREGGGNARL